MKKTILLLLLIASPCWAQTVREYRQNKRVQLSRKIKVLDKKFWLATLVIVGTTLLDVESTAHCVGNHTCAEGNPIYGKHPTRARMYAIKAPLAGFTIWATWSTKKDDMIRMERYLHRNDPNMPEPRIWEKPSTGWYLPSLIYGGITGGVGMYNVLKQFPKQPASSPSQPIRLPSN